MKFSGRQNCFIKSADIFLKLLFILTAFYFAGFKPTDVLANEFRYKPSVEIRAVWLDRKNIPANEYEIRQKITQLADSGINLIFPEVIYNGYSAYKSEFLRQQDNWNGIDILSLIIDECHKNKIEVHPWVRVFRAGYKDDKGGILSTHDDWVAKDFNGNSLFADGSYWLCPSNIQARKLLINAYCELVKKYDIDGIHLDYIRYADQTIADSCYDDRCIDSFKNETGIDPREIEPYTPQVIDWHLWREKQIYSFVAQCNNALKSLNPKLIISAAVVSPYSKARTNYFQNWVHWCENGWLDFVVPMEYTGDDKSFIRRMSKNLSDTPIDVFTLSGIGAHVLKNDQIIRQIGISEFLPTDGFSVFSASYLSSDTLEWLKNSNTRQNILLPFRNPLLQSKILSQSVMKRLIPPIDPIDLIVASIDASRVDKMIRYTERKKSNRLFKKPSLPPIFIPDAIQPIPSFNVLKLDVSPNIDGMEDACWRNVTPVYIEYGNLGFPISNKTEIRVGFDDKNIYLYIAAFEKDMSSIKANINKRDDLVFNDDSIEIFFASKNDNKETRHFMLNTIGTKFDCLGTNLHWDPDWEYSVTKASDKWIAEVRIPLGAIGITDISDNNMQRINICRNRYPDNMPENSCWSIVYGAFDNPSRFGCMYFNIK